MELSKEFIEEHKLEEAQATAISTFAATHIADLKGEWDGKANKDAEAILDGAAAKIKEVTGFERAQGVKIGDYISAAYAKYSETKTGELDTKIAELDEKIKNSGGDETLKTEYKKLQVNYEELQKKEAGFDELMNSGIKDKYDTLTGEHSVLKLDVAFASVKPSFPDTVNTYESLAKWETFKKEILKENTLELVDGEWLAINKENKHKQSKLSELVSKDADLTKLLESRKQDGPNGKEVVLTDIEGVPFKVPTEATSAERSKLINDHLDSKGVGKTDPNRATMFKTLHDKILESKKAV